MRTREREKGKRYDERTPPVYWWREAETARGWANPWFELAYKEARSENNRWEHARNQAIRGVAWAESKRAALEKSKEKSARRVAVAAARAEKQRERSIEVSRETIRKLASKPGVIVTVMDEEEVGRLGPKMAALPNDRWRGFVIAYLGMRKPSALRAYKTAFPDAADSTAAMRGGQLLRDMRIKEAIHEEALSRLESGMLVKALNMAEMILDDPQNPRAAAVAFGIMDRAGLHPKSEHRVTVEKTVDFGDAAQVLRLKEKLERLGFDPLPVLGNRLAALVAPKDVTDAEYSELPGEAAE